MSGYSKAHGDTVRHDLALGVYSHDEAVRRREDRAHDEAEREERNRVALVADRAATALSLTAAARTRAAALARPCAAHGAEPGAWCWQFDFSGVRGICTPRYTGGVVALSTASAGTTAPHAPVLARPEAPSKLERRHHNRQHLREVRG